MENSKNCNKAIIIGMFAGLITLISGFGIIYLLWMNLGTRGNLLGLFDYKAATYGDAICLPILIGTMVTFIQMNCSIGVVKNKCLLFGVLAGTVGIGIQASWLLNDNTGLNWTIPMPHHFNVAGWYHSIFFIGMFFTITYLVSNIYYITKDKSEFLFIEQVDLILFVSSGVLFVFCFLLDDYAFIFHYGIGFVLVAVAFFIVLVFVLKNRNKVNSNIIFIISTGIIIAMGLFITLFMEWTGSWILALAGTMSTCFLWKNEKMDIIKFFAVAILFFCGSYGFFYLLTSDVNMVCKICVISILIFLLILIDGGMAKKESESGVIIIIAIYLCFSKLMKGFVMQLNNLPSFVFLVVVFLIFNREIKNVFDNVIDAEEKKGNGKIDNEKFLKIKMISYTKITCGIIPIIILIMDLLISISNMYGKFIANGKFIFDRKMIILTTFGIIILLFIGILREIGIKNKFTETVAMIVITMEYILLFVHCITEIQNVVLYKLALLKQLAVIFAVFANLGSALLVGHGFKKNLISLRGLPSNVFVNIISIVISINCFFIAYISSILVALDTTWLRAVSLLIINFAAFFILPVISAVCLKNEPIKSNVVPNGPVGGVAQDGLLIFLIILFASYFVCLYCGMMKDINLFSFEGLDFIIGLFGLLGTAFMPLNYCLINNRNHLIRQRRVALREQDGMQRWEILRKEIVIQSCLACIAMLPYIIIVILSEILRRYVNRTNGATGKEEFTYLWDKYIETNNYDELEGVQKG